MIFPAGIFLVGASLIPFIKGKARKVFAVLVPLLALVNILLIKSQTSWVVRLSDFNLTLVHADKLSLFVAYIFGLMGLLLIIYGLRVEETGHYVSAFLYIGGALGVVFAGDFITLYAFWELMAVASTGLIWLNRRVSPMKVGFRYFLMHFFGGAVLLAGILLSYGKTGSLAIGPVPPGLPFLLIFIGVGLNAGIIPLHTWLPDAYPTALFTGSVLLCVFTTKTAVYVLARTCSGSNLVAYMGAAMALYGVTFALMQGNARKLLSYHVISQVGYMVAAVGIGTAIGINGGIAHVFNHILYKSLLFMCIGAVIYATGKEDLTELGGLARKMPITTICCVIAALSIAGVPGFSGYVSKQMIYASAHKDHTLSLMLELASVGTFLSFLKFTYFGFLRKNDQIEAKEAPLNMLIPMVIVACLCVGVGVYPKLITGILPHHIEFEFYELERVIGALQLLVAATAVFALGKKFYEPHKREILDFDYFYINGGRFVLSSFSRLAAIFSSAWDKTVVWIIFEAWSPFSKLATVLDSAWDKTVVWIIFEAWSPLPKLASFFYIYWDSVIIERIEKITQRLSYFCILVRNLNGCLNWAVSTSLVDSLLPRPGEKITLPTFAEETAEEMPAESVSVGAEEKERLSFPSLGDICVQVEKVDHFWDRFLTRLLVEAWVIAGPGGTVTEAEIPSSVSSIFPPPTTTARERSFQDVFMKVCYFARDINSRLDGTISALLVDMWLSEPTVIVTTAETPSAVPSLPTTTLREKWLKVLFMRLCYLVRGINYYLDRVISTLLVDMWLSEPGVMATKGIPKRKTPRISVFRKLNTYLDNLIASIKVDIWQSAPVGAKAVAAPSISIKEVKRRILEFPSKSFRWIRDNPRQIVSFLLGLVIVLIIVLVFLIALGYIRF